MQQLGTARTTAAWCALAGGVMWAVTPLRDLVLGGGADPRDGVGAFRAYNAYLVLAVLLMSVGLVRLLRTRPAAGSGRGHLIAIGAMSAGHVLLAAGSLVGVLLGDRMRGLVMAGQDLGFLAAMLAAAGALVLGVLGLRRASVPPPAAVLFACVLPLGIVGAALLAVAGAGEDLVGLPLTALYGGGFVALGIHHLTGRHRPDRPAASASAGSTADLR